VKGNRHWMNREHAIETQMEIQAKCQMFLPFCVNLRIL
jgi:hypothetical protein